MNTPMQSLKRQETSALKRDTLIDVHFELRCDYMITKIAKLGNSVGVRIPKTLLEVVGLSDSDNVEIIAEKKMLIIKPVKERLTIEKLFQDWDGEGPEPYDWGKLDTPMGRELI
jgi:antitoxin MazE